MTMKLEELDFTPAEMRKRIALAGWTIGAFLKRAKVGVSAWHNWANNPKVKTGTSMLTKAKMLRAIKEIEAEVAELEKGYDHD
jgi:hypothetical protein